MPLLLHHISFQFKLPVLFSQRIISLFARKAKIELDQGKYRKFLQKNRKVLRFWAFWDDRCQLDGYLRKFVVHYFLEDDTIEIKEIQFNSRTDVFPTFLNRGKLWKVLSVEILVLFNLPLPLLLACSFDNFSNNQLVCFVGSQNACNYTRK